MPRDFNTDPVVVGAGKKRAEAALRELHNDLPMARGYSEVPFDREQAFVMYCSFSGDVVKTAHALDVKVDVVLKLEVEAEWRERLAAVLTLKQSQRPGEVERLISRATNFAQAQRMRLFLERVITKLYRMTDEELLEFCFITEVRKIKGSDDTIETKKISTRPFADLASALEKVHMLTYAALADAPAERVKRRQEEDDGKVAMQDVHAQLAAAVAKAAGDQAPRALLFNETLENVKRYAEEAKPVPPPPATDV